MVCPFCGKASCHHLPDAVGPLRLEEPDGSVTFVRDELMLQRILRALRKPGPLYVHERPKDS